MSADSSSKLWSDYFCNSHRNSCRTSCRTLRRISDGLFSSPSSSTQIVTVVMVFVLTVIIAAGVLGVIARLAVYSFVVVSFLYSCSLNLWCEALFLIKKSKFSENLSSPQFLDTFSIFWKTRIASCIFSEPNSKN